MASLQSNQSQMKARIDRAREWQANSNGPGWAKRSRSLCVAVDLARSPLNESQAKEAGSKRRERLYEEQKEERRQGRARSRRA